MADNTFEVEYAPNNRARCKGPCKEAITKGQLRLVKMHKSGFSEDKLARDYFHPKCMFQSFHRVKEGTRIIEKTKDIKGLSELKKSDQEKVKQLLADWKADKIPPVKIQRAGNKAAGKRAPAARSGGTKRKREEKPKRPKGVFGGVVFAIDCGGRLALIDKIEDEGGRVVGSITQLVSYVVTDDTEGKSPKLAKAKTAGKKLVSPDWIDKKIKEGKKVWSSSSSSSEEAESSSEEAETTKKPNKSKTNRRTPTSSSSSDEEENKEANKSKKKNQTKGEKVEEGKEEGEEAESEEGEAKNKVNKTKKKTANSDDDEDAEEPPAKKQKKANKPDLSDCTICISGSFPKYTRNELTGIITKAGGTISGSISQATTHLLTSEPDGTTEKVLKAKKLGKKIVGIEFLGDLV